MESRLDCKHIPGLCVNPLEGSGPDGDSPVGSSLQKQPFRARVEHVFAMIKRVFGFIKVRYRGLDKNANALFVLCALTNLYLACRRL
jgi:Transposase DDE domain